MLNELITPRMRRGLEQMKTALTGQPEYVPVMAQLAAHTLRLTGVDEEAFWADPEIFLRSHLMASEYYQLDTPSTYFDLYNVEAEALGQELVWLKNEFPEIDRTRQLLRDPGDLDTLPAPDPHTAARMPFVIQVFKRLTDLGLNPTFRFCAPFSLAANVRGIDNLIMDILDRPEWAHRLFDFLTCEVLAPYLSTARDVCGADMPVLGADALASLPITNPAIIEEFALGYTLKLRDMIGNVAAFGWWGASHASDPEAIFDLKLKASPTYFYCLDPDAHSIGPERIKAYAERHDRPLILGLDCPLLEAGPIEAIVDRVRHYVTVGNRGGRLTFFLNAVPSDAPPEHVIAAVQAVKFYGSREAAPDAVFQPPEAEPFGDWVRRRGWLGNTSSTRP
jgi:uroporphyrinogen-III decarboxylase